MSAKQTTKQTEPIDPAACPLNGYSVAIQACIDVAQGTSKSRLRLEAAAMLLEHCSEPPWIDWGFVPVDDED